MFFLNEVMTRDGGVLPIMAYMGRLKGISFSGFRYVKGISQVEVYKRVGKSVILVFKSSSNYHILNRCPLWLYKFKY